MTTTFPQAPQPSAKELKARTSVVRQAWRFAILNTKMILMVSKGHH
ncbi:MAG: hypothetical protein V9E82_01295 [Candidatus Nanopelagicales bacterium]